MQPFDKFYKKPILKIQHRFLSFSKEFFMKQKIKPVAKFLLFVLIFLVSLISSFFLCSAFENNLNNAGKWAIGLVVASVITLVFGITRQFDKEEKEAEHFKEPHK
jgi:ABC-type transport system involved in Fe-S cluster assembly fused permease/ATPase subunit